MSRDLVLARLAAARGFVTRIQGQLDEVIELFLCPEEDPKGHDRSELFEGVIDDAGRLSRVIEKVQEVFETLDPMEPSPEETDDEEEEASSGKESPLRQARRK